MESNSCAYCITRYEEKCMLDFFGNEPEQTFVLTFIKLCTWSVHELDYTYVLVRLMYLNNLILSFMVFGRLIQYFHMV